MKKTKVLFVCLGNICRSPTAEGIFRRLLKEQNLEDHFEVDSAGTSAHHLGESPDPRSQKEALSRGTDLSFIRSRQFIIEDYYAFDEIFAMDERNLSDIKDDFPENSEANLSLLLDHHPDALKDRSVPDPYWGGDKGFSHVYDIIESSLKNYINKQKL